MPPGPEILTLENFIEQHLDALLTATSRKAFDAALDALLAPSATIVLNGAPASRAAYGDYMWRAQAHERSATVDFKGVVAVPRDSKAIVQVRAVLEWGARRADARGRRARSVCFSSRTSASRRCCSPRSSRRRSMSCTSILLV